MPLSKDDIKEKLIRDLSLVLLFGVITAAGELVPVLREPQKWILVPYAWMGTLGVQKLLQIVLRTSRAVWVTGWIVLGAEADALMLRAIKARDARLDRFSFVLLWLLACFGGVLLFTTHAPTWRPIGLILSLPYFVPPAAAATALGGHLISALLLDRRPGRMLSARAIQSATVAVLLTLAVLYWLPEDFLKTKLVLKIAAALTIAIFSAVLWRLGGRYFEKTLRIVKNVPAPFLRNPLLPAVVLALIFMVSGLSGLLASRRGADGAPGLPNVILITVDTLRGDHLSVFGYPLPTSPNLDRFGESSTIFPDCMSTASITLPSTLSLLTSRYPSFHSVGPLDYGPAARVAGDVTLPLMLAKNGYATAAFVSNFVLRHEVGLYRGFDVYDDKFPSLELVRKVPERVGGKTNESVLNWLSCTTGRRFFLWVHYQDPHGPYLPPEKYRRQFPVTDYHDTHESLPIVGNFAGGGIPRYQFVDGLVSPLPYKARYDGEISYVDHCIGQLLARIRDLGLWDKSIILLTADHGEAMGEHGYYFSHGQDLTRELIHVPLIIHIPGMKQTRRVDELVSNVDVVPTILDALGLKNAPGSNGLSLMPLIEGKTSSLKRDYVVAEDSHLRVCFLSRDLKYISGRDGERLYDVVRDPQETENLLEKGPYALAGWRALRDSYLESALPHKVKTALRYDPDLARKFKSLGYLE